MKQVWIVAEQRDAQCLPVALELATAARGLASEVHAITWGAEGQALAEQLGRYGVQKVFDVGDVGDSLAGPVVAAAIAQLLDHDNAPEALLVGSTYNGRDIAARLSARIDRPLITNVVGLEARGADLVSRHSAFGGAQTVQARFTSGGPAVFVVRGKSFAASETGGPPAAVQAAPAPNLGRTNAAKVVARHVDARSGPSLDEATIIVAGGRGMGSAEGFQLVEELARVVHGAAGASRAVVDAGWVPYSYQIGQTGKIVKPEVYLALGISGAIQHRIGMKDAKHIIAVDKDPSAPIFQLADLGIVGDVHEIVPRLVDALKNRNEP
jgi:electron transfer flavoprotein alpha subunit